MKAETLLIGTDGVQATDSATTLKQIQAVEALECALEHEGEKISWEGFDNPNEPRSLFQSIFRDRKRRVDEHTMMADRPSFAVVTATGGKVVRLEYYEGHDALQLVFDLRSKELQGKKLPNFLDEDPQAYNPAKFLEEFFGIPESVSKSVLEEAHEGEQQCEDMSAGFDRDEHGNPVCPCCGGDLVIFGAEPGDVQGMCPICDNKQEPKKCTCEAPKPVMRKNGDQQHFVCDTCKGIADDWILDIWKHMTDAGDRTVPFKPQYERGGWIYTCPLCGHTISSHSYLNVGYFQIACGDHIKECVEKSKVAEEK